MWALLLALAVLAAPAPAGQDAADPDGLYAAREHLPSALEAARIWDERLSRNARDFEAAWKLARVCYWLGGHVPADERRAQYERGIRAGAVAADLQPDRPEGHFWTAANMGALAESFGLGAGLRYRGPVKRALETVLRLDPAFQQGSADRALGRWYQRVPGLFGGSKTKAIEHLQRSLTYNPASTASLFFLADTYFDMGRRDDARRAAQAVLDAPLDPEWAPEDREFKARAKELLARIR